MRYLIFHLFILPVLLFSDDTILGDYFDKNSVVMLLIEPESGGIIHANLSATKFYGYPLEKLQKMSIQEINTFTPEQVKEERLKAITEKRNYFIFRHKLSNGEVKRVEVYSHPIIYDGKKSTSLYDI